MSNNGKNQEEKLDPPSLPSSPPKGGRLKLNPDAFPAFGAFVKKAIPYAEASGGRFLKQDVLKARECVEKKKQPTVAENARLHHLIKVLPLFDEYRKRVEKGDSDLKLQCMDAQRMVVREGVEKACLSAIHQLEIERDPKIKGEDWDNLDQPFTHCTSKLLNYFEGTRRKRKDWSRTLLTGMFVTDFGLLLGLKKVPCHKDERLLENYLAKADRYSKEKGQTFDRNQVLEHSFVRSLQGLQSFFEPMAASISDGIKDGIKQAGDGIKSTAAKITAESQQDGKKGMAINLLATGGGLVVSGVSNLVNLATKSTEQGAKKLQDAINKRRSPKPSPRSKSNMEPDTDPKEKPDGPGAKPGTNDLFID